MKEGGAREICTRSTYLIPNQLTRVKIPCFSRHLAKLLVDFELDVRSFFVVLTHNYDAN